MDNFLERELLFWLLVWKERVPNVFNVVGISDRIILLKLANGKDMYTLQP